MKFRPGFTFLEIIIVIAIVALMAVMAVSSFGVARQKAKVDILADNLVSLIQQQSSLAKSGKALACFGIEFHASKTGAEAVQLVTIPYKKVEGMKADFCDSTHVERTTVEDMKGFTLRSIQQQQSLEDVSTTDLNDFVLVFKPPFAKLIVGDTIDNLSLPGSSDPFIKISVADENGKEFRSFAFDTTTQLGQKLPSDSTP